MKRTFAAFAVSFGIALCAQSPPDQPPTCGTKQEPGFMVSWAGQPAAKDHSEERSLTKGTHLACTAIAAEPSKAACSVTMENDGHFLLQTREAIRIPRDDFVILTCKGKTPTCCKVQMTTDPTPMKKSDTHPQPEPQLGIVGEKKDPTLTGDGNGA